MSWRLSSSPQRKCSTSKQPDLYQRAVRANEPLRAYLCEAASDSVETPRLPEVNNFGDVAWHRLHEGMVLELISRAAAEDRFVAGALFDRLRARAVEVVTAIETAGTGDVELKTQKWWSVLRAIEDGNAARAAGSYPPGFSPRGFCRRGSSVEMNRGGAAAATRIYQATGSSSR